MTGIHCGAVSREYPQVLARAGRIASGLAAAGVGAGDRVAIYLHNDIAAIEASIGAGILGATPVPVNWHWKGAELAYLLDDSGSRVVFAHTDLVPTAEAVAGDRLIVEVAQPGRSRRPAGTRCSRNGSPGTTCGPSRRRRRRRA